MGGFYKVYGKDAYIISGLFEYKIVEEKEKIISCAFPLKSINKVIAKIENKKINYIILDRRDNYNVNEKVDFKNLNIYNNEYEKIKKYVNNKIRIEKIYKYLLENVKKEEIKNKLKEIETILYEKREF